MFATPQYSAVSATFPISTRFLTLSLHRVGGDNFNDDIRKDREGYVWVTVGCLFWAGPELGPKSLADQGSQKLALYNSAHVGSVERLQNYLSAWAWLLEKVYSQANVSTPRSFVEPADLVWWTNETMATHALQHKRLNSRQEFIDFLAHPDRIGKFIEGVLEQ